MKIGFIVLIVLMLLPTIIIILKVYKYKKMVSDHAFINKVSEFFQLIDRNRKEYFQHSTKEKLKEEYRCYFEKMKLNKIYSINNNTELLNFFQIYSNLDDLVKKWNEVYIEKELLENEEFMNDIDGKSLDQQQRMAVVIDEDNNLVVAGAGSGKTLTIAAKVKYLVDIKDVNPDQILLLSFTRKAAGEMEETIRRFNIDVRAWTFHALGLNIISGNKAYRPDLFDGLSRVIDDYFEKEMIKNKDLTKKIINFFGYYFNIPKDLENFENLGESFANSKNMDLETLKIKVYKKKMENQKQKVTIKGEAVKSLEEVNIANFLYLNGIQYEYEKRYPFPHNDPNRKQYRPDFYLPEYDIYLEHFGVTKDFRVPWLTPIEEKKYIAGITWKRDFHKQNNTTLLETYSYYSKEKGLLYELENILKTNNVTFKEVDYQDIYETLFKDGGDQYFSEFKKLVGTFIGLYKSNGYSEEYFGKINLDMQKIENDFLRERTAIFLSLVEPIYKIYQKKLKEENQIDFNDMINISTEIVRSGVSNVKFKYIIVDEYQDISVSRFNLIKEIKNQTGAKVMVVGDDWQSIYRFAGSDINLFTNFTNYLGYSEVLKIEMTYRNSQELINIAGKFIMANEKQLRKNLVSQKHHSNPIRILGYKSDILAAFDNAVEEIVYLNGEDAEIMVVARNNFDINVFSPPKDDSHKKHPYEIFRERDSQIVIRYKKYPKLKIFFFTAHRSKGLEAENVIVINLNDKLFGFPNKIADDPILSLVLTDLDEFDYAEERRLFYVAMTRTKNLTYLLAPESEKSIFIKELIRKQGIKYEFITNEKSLSDNPPCPRCQTGFLVLRENSADGAKFLGCINYPLCDNTFKQIELLNNYVVCTKCGGYMVRRKGRYGAFYGCTNYPFCRNTIDIQADQSLSASTNYGFEGQKGYEERKDNKFGEEKANAVTLGKSTHHSVWGWGTFTEEKPLKYRCIYCDKEYYRGDMVIIPHFNKPFGICRECHNSRN